MSNYYRRVSVGFRHVYAVVASTRVICFLLFHVGSICIRFLRSNRLILLHFSFELLLVNEHMDRLHMVRCWYEHLASLIQARVPAGMTELVAMTR